MHVQSNGGWLARWLARWLAGWLALAGRPAGRNPPPPPLGWRSSLRYHPPKFQPNLNHHGGVLIFACLPCLLPAAC